MDYAAATPVSSAALRVMEPYFSDQFYNPSAMYLAARGVRDDLQTAREQVARSIGCRAGEVIFTAGGTESCNLAIRGVLEQHSNGHVVVSAIEHDAVMHAAQQYDHSISQVAPNGVIDPQQLAKVIKDNTVLVSVMHANNEIGTVQPIKEIASTIEDIRAARKAAGNTTPLLLHTDASQAPNYLDINTARLSIDLMTLNGGKIYGPKQSGCLFVKAGVRLSPQILGGGQEMGMRSGTENVAFAVGFATSLEQAAKKRKSETERLQQLQSTFMKQLEALGGQINGSKKQRLPNSVHVTLQGTDNERLIMELDERGIMAASGSACQASSDEPSHVLQAIGLAPDAMQSSLRFSMGRATTSDDIDYVISALGDILPMVA